MPLLGTLAVAAPAHASILEDINSNLSATSLSELGGGSSNTLPKVIGGIIGILLGFLGILFIVLIIWAGFQWMTAGGDEARVKKAKQLIINATIGILIILASYGITQFIIVSVINAVSAA
ncbi:MAG: hypothetical protein WC516_03110 [Patescibacteria group bacterium]